ncbi:uncharacterized protein LOC131843042 isoform X2 [Achroia grisella]|uniref:uncharacterized protein LOC131843042 isoform X2 n=1 Tax=Achroia grisella TaxID=688607 RepID=UPI0027D348E2|nr:uncharacterized protein LOC131843042 isoform X2 [Achroia grisella]
MGATCVVDNCKRESYPGCGISFHRLPLNPELRKKWIDVLPNKIRHKHPVICSLHFKPDDYRTASQQTLKASAIPSIFKKYKRNVINIGSLRVLENNSSDSESFLTSSDDSESEEAYYTRIASNTSQPNSPDLIKPIQVERCQKCNGTIGTEAKHTCGDAVAQHERGLINNYVCTGCSQSFETMQVFDLHISGLHSDDVESMFFPTMTEFLSWKNHMETQINIKYLILSKCNSKHTYRCTFLPSEEPTDNMTALFCPSSIVVQEFSKGIQVHYYKQHFGHQCSAYTLIDKYKKYHITSFIENAAHYEYTTVVEEDDKDLYVQFKTLMESIVLEAAKVKIDTLKVFVGKALEMTTMLTNYEEDEEMTSLIKSNTSNKNMSDDQISQALQNLQNSKIHKRKLDNDVAPDKKKKRNTDITHLSPKIVNAFSMAGIQDKENGKKDLIVEKQTTISDNEVEKTKQNDTKSVSDDEDAKTQKANKTNSDDEAAKKVYNSLMQSPSYNDTYKDFLDKNFKKGTETKTMVKKGSNTVTPTVNVANKKDNISKTKADTATNYLLVDGVKGISTSNVSTIGKTIVNQSTSNIVPKQTINKKDKLITKSDVTPKTESKNTSPLLKTTEMKKTANAAPKLVKKPVVKTKIGQFKPSLSPRKSTESNTSNSALNKSAVDVEYEVMEQEDDCNILILKI